MGCLLCQITILLRWTWEGRVTVYTANEVDYVFTSTRAFTRHKQLHYDTRTIILSILCTTHAHSDGSIALSRFLLDWRGVRRLRVSVYW